MSLRDASICERHQLVPMSKTYLFEYLQSFLDIICKARRRPEILYDLLRSRSPIGFADHCGYSWSASKKLQRTMYQGRYEQPNDRP